MSHKTTSSSAEWAPCPFCGSVPYPEGEGFEHHQTDNCVLDSLWMRADELTEWNTRVQRTAIAASQPADPVTNGGCHPRSIEGCHKMTHPTDEGLDALVKLTEEFVTATWHLLDNSETSGPKDDPTITVGQSNFDEVSALLDRCEGLPSGSVEHMAAGELLAANLISAINALRARLAAAHARADRATLEAAPRVNETPKSEHDRADALTALPAAATLADALQVPTNSQVASACMSYRHNFGLLPARDREALMFQAREWLLAWQKELPTALRAIEESEK